jgi:protein-S-isoprenylcysteine O-methyltransferase Ste14
MFAEQVAVWRAQAAIRDAHMVVKALTGRRGQFASGAVVSLLVIIGTVIAMSQFRALLLPTFLIVACAVVLVLILAYVRLTAAEASLYAMIEDVMRLEEERHRLNNGRDYHA